jgi:hypothetical protein
MLISLVAKENGILHDASGFGKLRYGAVIRRFSEHRLAKPEWCC